MYRERRKIINGERFFSLLLVATSNNNKVSIGNDLHAEGEFAGAV